MLHLIAGLALVTVCAIVLVNLRHDKASALYDAFNFDDLSRTMMVSIAEEKPMQVTLDNRKAYVGFVIDTVEPNQDASFLTLFPLYSGYRDESSLELKLSNDYFTTSSFEDIGTNNPDDFGIVIPRSKIVTCHIFNTDLHKAISKQRKELLAASIE